MAFELTILSIFRQSETYLDRYFSQIEQAFALRGGICHAVWLEGDSEDATYPLLQSKKEKLESQGHHVTLVKFDLKGPYWNSMRDLNRWAQLATCWNRCLEHLLPSKLTVCVESDLIWDPSTIEKIIPKLSSERKVICPMLMTENSLELFGVDHFYDIWGFSRNGKKFSSFSPYWKPDPVLKEDHQFVQVSTGGGMIVSSYEEKRQAKWALDCCILHFPKEIEIFMDKTVKIHHPVPEKWKNMSFLNRMLRMIKYQTLVLTGCVFVGLWRPK
jgi:hypothetical protein